MPSKCSFPAITGVALRQPAHDSVAGDLGDDRGRGDREAQRVALDDCLHRARQSRGDIAVDQRDVGAQPQRRHRPRHRRKARPQNIDPINLAPARRPDADADRPAPGTSGQGAVAAFPQIAAQYLRIIEHAAQFAAEAPAVDDDRGGDHRAGQRSPPGLVNAANDPRAAALDGEIRHCLLAAFRWPLVPLRHRGGKRVAME